MSGLDKLPPKLKEILEKHQKTGKKEDEHVAEQVEKPLSPEELEEYKKKVAEKIGRLRAGFVDYSNPDNKEK